MMMDTSIKKYIKSWYKFRTYCEDKAKGKCYLNNNAWRKLRQYHLKDFLSNKTNPLFFLRLMRYKYPEIFNEITNIHKIYYKFVRKMDE
jgi:transcription antitermination factor NusA-like protein